MTYREFEVGQIKAIKVQDFLAREMQSNNVQEILEGLLAEQKHISSKFFYNKKGSELFEEITKLQEYYPTRTEKKILKTIAPRIFGNLKNVRIIELGSGDCSKISILLSSIRSEFLDTITYVPVDVSATALKKSVFELVGKFPGLNIEGVVANFLNQYEYLESETRKIICFLGSTIGNLTKTQAKEFIKNISSKMHPGDLLLLGADMVKSINVVEAAYNDTKQVTADFNKNILNNVNHKLGTQIGLENFKHKAFYNKYEDRIEMHLVCLKNQSYSIYGNGQSIQFTRGETIHTENSHKYTIDNINEFAIQSELQLREVFNDERKYFSVCLFEK